MHLEIVRSDFDQSAEIVETIEGVPEHWKDYTSASEAERLLGARQELKTLSKYFPRAAAELEKTTIDAFIVRVENMELCRIFMVQVEGEAYVTYSRCPTLFCKSASRQPYALLLKHAPEAFSWVYQNLMDGLVDPYDLTGFVPSDRLTTMGEHEFYENFDWYNSFVANNDPTKVLEFFSSGGGAYMLLDLNKDWRTVPDPQALRISSQEQDWTPDKPVDFWPFLDAWMAIGLAGS